MKVVDAEKRVLKNVDHINSFAILYKKNQKIKLKGFDHMSIQQ